ncbi:unnamed protein product [Boreogadus saida]
MSTSKGSLLQLLLETVTMTTIPMETADSTSDLYKQERLAVAGANLNNCSVQRGLLSACRGCDVMVSKDRHPITTPE